MLSKEEKLKTVWKDYSNGKAYFKNIGIETAINTCVDFFEGRQWGNKISDRTKSFPRPVFNQTEMIANSKNAGILATPLSVVFSSNKYPDLARKLTNFNSYMEKEMKLDEKCEEVVEQGSVEGCSFLHAYWDSDAVGRLGEYLGGVRVERLEPLNVMVHNPRETDIQKQKWILIVTRCEIDAVKDMCRNKQDRILIESDKNEDSDTTLEQDGSKLVTVLTKYFRINGEVYFEKYTKNVILCENTPLNPDLNKKLIKISEDSAETPTPDTPNKVARAYKASLYPISIYQYKSRKNCIYGRGEVEPIIQNNRTVNFNTAMMSKCVEDQGFGQVVAKEGTMLKGEKFTNDPTKILIDRYKGGQGFYNLQKQPFSPQAYQLNKDIMETTRSVTGATEVMTGEIMGANQSGASIAYLQQQAQKPIDKLAKRYRKFRQSFAEILMQFYILYYQNGDKEFENQVSENDIKRMLLAQGNIDEKDLQNIEFKREDLIVEDRFDGREFKDKSFDVTIEIGAGTQYSEIVTISILDNLLNSNRISLRTYYNIYPSNLLPNKKELLEDLDKQENNQINILSQKIQSLESQLVQYESIIKQQSEIVNNIMPTIQKNRTYEALLAKLQAEYSVKIKEANQKIITAQSDANDLATLMELDQLDRTKEENNATNMQSMQNSINKENV